MHAGAIVRLCGNLVATGVFSGPGPKHAPPVRRTVTRCARRWTTGQVMKGWWTARTAMQRSDPVAAVAGVSHRGRDQRDVPRL